MKIVSRTYILLPVSSCLAGFHSRIDSAHVAVNLANSVKERSHSSNMASDDES